MGRGWAQRRRGVVAGGVVEMKSGEGRRKDEDEDGRNSSWETFEEEEKGSK